MAAKPRLLGKRYELDGIVGRGGTAEVFRARDIRRDRVVAVKTLQEDLARDQTFQARFRREAQSAASLNHPSIVAVYDTGEEMLGGTSIPYIVMEFVDGRTLRELLRDERRLAPKRAAEITDGVLRALEHSHHNGVVHRDIKPGNVMLTRNGDVKVINFSTVGVVSEAHEAHDAQVIGTAQYLSPEQATGEATDARSDLYSTGCLLYELLTGRAPFSGDSPVAIAYRHVKEEPVPPSRVDPGVPAWADAIVLKAIQKNPANRYQSAGEMRNDIQRALRGAPVSTSLLADLSRTALSQVAPQPSTLRVSAAGPTGLIRPAVRPTVVRHPVVVGIHEAPMRRSEPIGDEPRLFNNARSSSTSVESIRVSYESTMSVVVDLTKTRALSGGAGISFANIVVAKASLSSELARRYLHQLDEKLTFEQMTTVNIPANTNVEVIFHWKRIWATGLLRIGEQAKRLVEVAEVPFEITVGLAFDKETRDLD